MTAPDPATTAAITEAKRAILRHAGSSTTWTTLTLQTVDLVAALAVEAARPVIEAEATARERQRIREAITSHPQLGEWADVSDALAAIAELLDAAS